VILKNAWITSGCDIRAGICLSKAMTNTLTQQLTYEINRSGRDAQRAEAHPSAQWKGNEMNADTDIVATGGFNTGRLYTDKGQRIFWAQRADGWLFFNDRDRMVSGWVERTGPMVAAGVPVVPAWLMGKYDEGKFQFYAPNQTERNPSAPVDFDYGAALHI
jgi:hypothetical protein